MILINTPIEINGKIFHIDLQVRSDGYEPDRDELLEILENIIIAAQLYQDGVE